MRLRDVVKTSVSGNSTEPLQPPLPSGAPPSPSIDGNDSQTPYTSLQSQRRAMPIAPSNITANALPAPLYECGCGDCPPRADPLHGSFEEPVEGYWKVGETCESPAPVSWEKATQIYKRLEIPNFRSEDHSSKAEQQLSIYREICATDRRLRREYSDMTTALLTLRVTPRQNDEWVSPWRLDEALHSPWSDVYDRLRYELSTYGGFDWEYCAVTEGTDWFATPHRHVLCWIDDADNEIDAMHFRSAIETFVEQSSFAPEDSHSITDETAVWVDHDPSIAEESGVCGNPFDSISQGALYTATSLPHLSLRDRFSSDESCTAIELDGASLAWTSPYKWVNSSKGVSHAE